jgi:hypothetical protein
MISSRRTGPKLQASRAVEQLTQLCVQHASHVAQPVASCLMPMQIGAGSTNGSTNAPVPTIVGSQDVDSDVILVDDRIGSHMLPKQMLYQAELRPDSAAHGNRFATGCDAMHRNATQIP